jgi:hypothetical protein
MKSSFTDFTYPILKTVAHTMQTMLIVADHRFPLVTSLSLVKYYDNGSTDGIFRLLKAACEYNTLKLPDSNKIEKEWFSPIPIKIFI